MTTLPVCGRPRPRDTVPLTTRATRARTDPVEFIESCFADSHGQPAKLAGVHEELQAFLSAHRQALVELPRDHGKSFQVCTRILWELGKNPALRVKVVCATLAVAIERSRFLRDAIANNHLVHEVFPELRRSVPWSATAFTIDRPTDAIGPSVAAFGIGTGSTGTRADLLVCDDVVDVRALRSRAERDRTADYFTNNLMNLLEPEGRCWCLFTPWHADDLNARLKKSPAFSVYRKPVGDDFTPVWPEKWPAANLRARKEAIGSSSFARGYLLRAIADEDVPIRPEWVRFWTDPAKCEQVILSVDPAVSIAAKADRSALVVLGRVAAQPNPPAPFPGREGETSSTNSVSPSPPRGGGWGEGSPQIRVLAAIAKRVAAPELVGLIDALDRRWNPAVILFETNAAFLGIKDLLVRHASFGPKVKGVTQSTDKAARVAAFSVAVENAAFRLHGDANDPHASQRELFDEMTTFPFGEHDDLLDATATGTAYLLDRREPRVW
jgi:predicted phage terminase large subunit-like protein